jgi:hypothetical protein
LQLSVVPRGARMLRDGSRRVMADSSGTKLGKLSRRNFMAGHALATVTAAKSAPEPRNARARPLLYTL